jgi:hypothetical protein
MVGEAPSSRDVEGLTLRNSATRSDFSTARLVSIPSSAAFAFNWRTVSSYSLSIPLDIPAVTDIKRHAKKISKITQTMKIFDGVTSNYPS